MDLYEASRRGYKHKNLIFWMAMIKSLTKSLDKENIVLDLGCGSGLFLQLLYEISPYGNGYGVDLDANAIALAKQRLETRNEFPIIYLQSSAEQLLLMLPHLQFDVVFCQEVFWMNEDLQVLAESLFALLKPGGGCYCTIGCHAGNPIWSFRQKIFIEEGLKFFTHHLDEIARIFSDVGFVVGLRRLPLDGFMMFHPQATPLNAGSFSQLVSSTYDHKMLFYFGKNEKPAEPKNIYD